MKFIKNNSIAFQLAELAFAGLFLFFCMRTAAADEKHDFFLAVAVDDGYGLSKMLRQGDDPNIREEQRGDTGLILALRERSMRAFEVLLNAPNVDLNAAANNGDTALMIASYTKNLLAVTELLEKNVEVNRPGWTALHYAAASGSAKIIRQLLDKSAQVNARSPNGTTPLMMAAGGGQLDVVKMLLESGADISLKNEQGLSALDFAEKNDRRDISDFLKQQEKRE